MDAGVLLAYERSSFDVLGIGPVQIKEEVTEEPPKRQRMASQSSTRHSGHTDYAELVAGLQRKFGCGCGW